jgi:hypothetical protein
MKNDYQIHTTSGDFVSTEAQKRGQEPIAKWPKGCYALLVPDPFSERRYADKISLLTIAILNSPQLPF